MNFAGHKFRAHHTKNDSVKLVRFGQDLSDNDREGTQRYSAYLKCDNYDQSSSILSHTFIRLHCGLSIGLTKTCSFNVDRARN